MKNQNSWYRRAKEIIREEGWMKFIEKVKKYLSGSIRSIRMNLDEFTIKIFTPLHISLFHKVYYYSKVWKKTYWLGIPVQKCPLDLWIYQEIIWETKPDFVIETGTAWGG